MWLTNVAPPPPRAADVPEEFKIIHLTMSDFEWYHLLQLWKDNPHSYQHQESLEREMRSLERLQLVRFKNQLSRWERLPQGEFLLRDHVDLTDFGKCFIVWRRQFRHTTRSGDGLRCHDYLYVISRLCAPKFTKISR